MGQLTRRAVKAAPQKKSAPATKPASAKKAEEPAAPPSRVLKPRRVDAAKLREAYKQQREQSSGGGVRIPFLKLTSGANVVRLLPSFNEERELPYVRPWIHTWRSGGRGYDALDLNYLFRNEELAAKARDEKKITDVDFEKWKLYGDPFNVAYQRVKDAGLPKESTPILYAAPKPLYLAVNRADGGVYVYQVSNTLQKEIWGDPDVEGDEGWLGDYPDLFDMDEGYDLRVTGNGKDKLARRYKFKLDTKPSKVTIGEDVEIPELESVVLSRVRGFDSKVAALFSTFGPLMELVGLSPTSFGVTTVAAKPAAASKDDDEETED